MYPSESLILSTYATACMHTAYLQGGRCGLERNYQRTPSYKRKRADETHPPERASETMDIVPMGNCVSKRRKRENEQRHPNGLCHVGEVAIPFRETVRVICPGKLAHPPRHSRQQRSFCNYSTYGHHGMAELEFRGGSFLRQPKTLSTAKHDSIVDIISYIYKYI